ncbi:MAG: hypothetical protein LBI88_01745 [Deltaproteobacteria bacterium]|jgi:hypothetical protein|nr:hypothetical protein [Deltaproteobacteria bacterium]
MSDAIGLNTLENIPALILAGGTESREHKQDRQGARGNSGAGGADVVSLSPEAEKQVQKLRERDREVRAHEQAHIAAGGQHVSGGASFSYQTGPDGRQYAVGGSVQIDTSPVPGNPESTEEKARAVRRAALAPASPSATDQSVAAKAAAMESKARAEKTEQTEDASAAGLRPGRIWPGPERAAAIYASMRDSALPQTALAPWGTGISLAV